jgi:hypothetical protein
MWRRADAPAVDGRLPETVLTDLIAPYHHASAAPAPVASLSLDDAGRADQRALLTREGYARPLLRAQAEPRCALGAHARARWGHAGVVSNRDKRAARAGFDCVRTFSSVALTAWRRQLYPPFALRPALREARAPAVQVSTELAAQLRRSAWSARFGERRGTCNSRVCERCSARRQSECEANEVAESHRRTMAEGGQSVSAAWRST